MNLFSLKTIQLFLYMWLVAELTDSTRCLNEKQLQSRYKRYVVRITNAASKKLPDPGPHACAEAARMGRNETAINRRSVSPWTYREDRRDDRFPAIIPFAECLCVGCIVGGQEDYSYVSIPVYTSLKVMYRSPCLTDVSKYAVTKDFIRVPVACTCVRHKI